MAKRLMQLNSVQTDVLQEIFNIGAGNAATSLSLLLKTRVDMEVPVVRLMPFAAVPEQVGGEEEVVAGVFLSITGDVGGSFLLVLPLESARNLVRSLFGFPREDTAGFNDLERSALLETGNIMAHAFLNAAAGLTEIPLTASVPDMAVDMAGAVLSVPLIRASQNSDYALVMEAQLAARGEKISCFFFLLPDVELLEVILRKLKVAEDGYTA